MLIVYMEILCTSSQIILWTKLISYEIARILSQGADVIHRNTYNITVFECNPVAATQEHNIQQPTQM